MKYIAVLLATLALLAPRAWADDYSLLEWDDLIPLEEQLNPPPFPEVDHEDEFAIPAQPIGKVVPTLNGRKVRLPGFVVPLEGDSKQITTFLLVPYFGACIHVPPPPTNQIVHVEYPTGAQVDDLWDAVWVTGTLRTVGASHEMGDAAYSLEGTSVEPYNL
ncbi:hypothetical protein BFR47_08650 [Oceanisphaera psychrotolerans]|uniref:DUF3299 domain-containing protein n=2 Tax=Oceanisphaera psychrotolerans TaxID=1414654 RepID=A0A1J4QJ80_9GAMM|nr:DUF3299 domain-containing protein [Oceanisphaera psychrotolerans]OIN14041.1 hypothetical protein BFR47_08650 [Oceanisphaera psychrotolerans]